MKDVSARRCASCHKQGVPRKFYTRITNIQDNSFLLAPLAKSAGGTQACGQAVFASTSDADYQAGVAPGESKEASVTFRPFAALENLLRDKKE